MLARVWPWLGRGLASVVWCFEPIVCTHENVSNFSIWVSLLHEEILKFISLYVRVFSCIGSCQVLRIENGTNMV